MESSAFPWIKHLPEDGQTEFFAELVDKIEEAQLHNPPGVPMTAMKYLEYLDPLIASWRATAGGHFNPEPLAVLASDHEPEDFVEVESPEDTARGEILPARHPFLFNFQRREANVDFYTSICKCGLPMDHFVHPGDHWFVFSFQQYDPHTKKWTDYCRKCLEPRTASNHFGEPSRDPRQPYAHTYQAGDVVRERKRQAGVKRRRYEILAVVGGGYHVKKLFAENDVEEFVWRVEGLEQSCELERAIKPSPFAEELDMAQAQIKQWRTAYFSLWGALDHHLEGDAIAMIERMRIRVQMWRRGDLDAATTLAGLYSELIEGRKLPPIDENLRTTTGNSD